MTISFNIDRLIVCGRPVFHCGKCKTSQQGEYLKIETVRVTDDLEDVAAGKVTSSSMPVGWASFSGGEHVCSSCL